MLNFSGRSIFPFWVTTCLAISPFLVFPVINGSGLYDNQRLIQISCVVFALAIISHQLLKDPSIPLLFRRPILLFLVIFFFLGMVSSFLAYSPRHAFFEWTNFLLLIGVSWIIALQIIIKGEVLIDKLLMMCGIACVLYLLLEVTLYITVLKIGAQPSMHQLIAGFNNYRFFNHVQTVSLPMLGLLAARLPDRSGKAFWWGVTSLWWMLLFVSAGRGTLLGVTIGIAVAWGCMKKGATDWCRSMALACLTGLVAFLFFYVAIPLMRGMQPFGPLFSGFDRAFENPSSGRFQLWRRALEIINSNPWFGVGPAHFGNYNDGIKYEYNNSHPHDWMLQIGSEWGVPALIFFCGALVLILKDLIKTSKKINPIHEVTITAWISIGFAILIDGLVSGLIVTPTSQLWIAVYIGCAWGWRYLISPPVKIIHAPQLKKLWGVVIFLAFLMTLALVKGVWPDLSSAKAQPESTMEKTLLRPRILGNGNF